jgi:hypothetical protein
MAVISIAKEPKAHKAPVAAIETITGPDGEYIASGDAAGELKVWKNNGEYVNTWSHSGIINCLKAFKDDRGGTICLLLHSELDLWRSML